MPSSSTGRRRAQRASIFVAGSAVFLTGCITGERPTIVPEDAIDDEAVGSVLALLEQPDATTFTAEYDITPSATSEITKATVVADDGRVSVSFGEITYVIDGTTTRTCQNGDCVDGIDDARISDLNITHRFWRESFASRLRLDAARQINFGRGRTDSIARQPANCVDIDVVGGTVTYCAIEDGVLARYFGADVSIELTAFLTSIDPTSFYP